MAKKKTLIFCNSSPKHRRVAPTVVARIQSIHRCSCRAYSGRAGQSAKMAPRILDRTLMATARKNKILDSSIAPVKKFGHGKEEKKWFAFTLVCAYSGTRFPLREILGLCFEPVVDRTLFPGKGFWEISSRAWSLDWSRWAI